jgi:hypothetical protein
LLIRTAVSRLNSYAFQFAEIQVVGLVIFSPAKIGKTRGRTLNILSPGVVKSVE